MKSLRLKISLIVLAVMVVSFVSIACAGCAASVAGNMVNTASAVIKKRLTELEHFKNTVSSPCDCKFF